MKRRSEAAFSLLEISIALACLAVGLASLMWLSAEVGRWNMESREVSAATLIAHNRMETLKLQGFSALTDAEEIDGTDGPLDATGLPSPSAKYNVAWDIQKDVPVAGVKRILVTVSWISETSRPKHLVLDTVVSDAVP